MVTTGDLITAYFDCRRNKRRTACAIEYEIGYERRIVALRDRINARMYEPGTSVCFFVTRPRKREVFAAAFEDRIVHHYICLRLEPLFEATFSPRSFNCRRGKGQLAGVTALWNDVRECSENYTRDCWIAKFDIKGFFMSIDRAALAARIDRFITERYAGPDIEDLRYLTRVVVMHAPEDNCELYSPQEEWDTFDPAKSLRYNGEGLGVAIGNLPSQMLANFDLDVLDWLILRDLAFPHFGRYVDDFYIVDTDKDRILAAAPVIREYLARIGVTLHPKKFYMQHYTKGVPFVGIIVKRDRIYLHNRTVHSLSLAVDALNAARSATAIREAVESINSYLGSLRHATEYATRRRVLSAIRPDRFEYVYIKGHFDSVALRRGVRPRMEAMEKARRYGLCG